VIIKPLTDSREWNWTTHRTNVLRCSDTRGLVAWEGEHILAACVADNFGPDQCSVHLAIDNPIVLKHRFLETLAELLFLAEGRKRLFGMVPSTNRKALKFNDHIGFKEVARVPNGYMQDVDYVIMCMERVGCRWLPEELREAA
jgi:hypothetical protein